MRYLMTLARLILGITLLFSGFVKLIDPVGTGLIMAEYLRSASLFFMIPASEYMGAVLSVVEFVCGVSLLTGLRIRVTSVITMVMLSFFTILTLLLALFDPIKDCGCFGEAIKLTNWETFFKNLILFACALFIFLRRATLMRLSPPLWGYILLSVYFIFAISISVYSFRYLPIIDFTSYSTGSDLRELSGSLSVPHEEFETTLIYEKGGERREFTISNIPDSTWSFVDAVTAKKSNDDSPLGAGFALINREGEYVTEQYVSTEKSFIFIVVPYMNLLKGSAIDKIKEFLNEYNSWEHRDKVDVLLLSGSSWDITDSILVKAGVRVPVLFSDNKTLISLSRSNGGAVYVNDGIIIKKWPWRGLIFNDISETMGKDSDLVSARVSIKEHLVTELMVVLLLIIIFFTRFICKYIFIKRVIKYADIGTEKS